MTEKTLLKAIVGIIILFAIGLVFYFIFSAPYGDGLEKTMENAGVEEGEPVYHAPLDYGEDYVTAFFAGLLGFGLVFGISYAYFKIAGKKKESKEAK
ncbi:MAG: cobalt transporter [Methanomassiliicoccales archaeon]|nr:cobalt transporter [Methanomassiliicoccales archaeon]